MQIAIDQWTTSARSPFPVVGTKAVQAMHIGDELGPVAQPMFLGAVAKVQ